MMSPTETPLGPRGRVTFTCKDDAFVYVDKEGGPKWATETEKEWFRNVAMECIQDASECGVSYCGPWVWISRGRDSDRSPAPEPSSARYSPTRFPSSGCRSEQIYQIYPDTPPSSCTLCCRRNCGKDSTRLTVIHCVNEISRNGSKERCLKKEKKSRNVLCGF